MLSRFLNSFWPSALFDSIWPPAGLQINYTREQCTHYKRKWCVVDESLKCADGRKVAYCIECPATSKWSLPQERCLSKEKLDRHESSSEHRNESVVKRPKVNNFSILTDADSGSVFISSDVQPVNIHANESLNILNRDSVVENVANYWKCIESRIIKCEDGEHIEFFTYLYNQLITPGSLECSIHLGSFKIIDLSKFIDLKSIESLAQESIDNLEKDVDSWMQIADTPHIFGISTRYMKRLQCKLHSITLLLRFLSFIFPRHCVTKAGVVTIVSLVRQDKSKSCKTKAKAKAKDQKCHVDYNKRRIFDKSLMTAGVTAPLVCLFALQDDTKIVIYKADGSKEIINIPKGSMFIMSGDCLHGGFGGYLKTNARLHWYLEAVDVTAAVENQTGWMNWSRKRNRWEPGISFELDD